MTDVYHAVIQNKTYSNFGVLNSFDMHEQFLSTDSILLILLLSLVKPEHSSVNCHFYLNT